MTRSAAVHLRPSIHPHIQRPFALQAETPLLLFQLDGGKTQIEQDPVDGSILSEFRISGRCTKFSRKIFIRFSNGFKDIPRFTEGIFIPFHADQDSIGCGSIEDLEGMAPSSQGGVHIDLMGSTSKKRDNLFHQNRDVSRPHEPPCTLPKKECVRDPCLHAEILSSPKCWVLKRLATQACL